MRETEVTALTGDLLPDGGLRGSHRGGEGRGHGSLAEAVPVEAFEPPEGQKSDALHDAGERSTRGGQTRVLLVLLDVLRSVLLVPQPLRRVVPETDTHSGSAHTSTWPSNVRSLGSD